MTSSSPPEIREDNSPRTTSSDIDTKPLVSSTSETFVESDKVITDKSKVDFTANGKFKFYPDNPEHHRHKYKWTSKEPSKFYDPCEESRQASISCLLRNQDDKYQCQDFFDAYRECKQDFFAKKKKDRLEGRKGWGW
ncbi:COX23 [[Candida] subhashii]|uniref:COX23 n=1 Tax=[Candida] subhashii TaxID=561895 RepID=A0A8J5UKT1_9ASCO|nr:COX23 [[Candida] subhashii]KAG7662222.1 COX23 [[Candida] subhashii]